VALVKIEIASSSRQGGTPRNDTFLIAFVLDPYKLPESSPTRSASMGPRASFPRRFQEIFHLSQLARTAGVSRLPTAGIHGRNEIQNATIEAFWFFQVHCMPAAGEDL
jgi:hypothetical protein